MSLKADDKSEHDKEHSTTIGVAKWIGLEQTLVTPLLVQTMNKRYYTSWSCQQHCQVSVLPAKGRVKALPNDLFSFFHQHANKTSESGKQKVLGRLNDKTYKTINT